MILKDLEDAVLDHFNYDLSASETRSRIRIRRHLNLWHRRILSMPAMSKLRDQTVTMTSVAGQAEYGIANAATRILRIYEQTNDQLLTPQTVDWYRSIEPDPQQGTAEYWISLGYRPTFKDPGTTGLWVVSASASDTAVVAHVQGSLYSDQDVMDVSATLNGTTRVALGSAVNWANVSKYYLSVPAVGNVSLYNAATSGTLLAVVVAGMTTTRYLRIALWPTPSSAIDYKVDVEMAIHDLFLATDEPLLPEEFHDLLELGARIEEYEKENDSRYPQARAVFARRLADLQAAVDIRPGYVGIPGEMVANRPSRLGAWFPAGS